MASRFVLSGLMLLAACGASAQELPPWAAKIRPDHPRLFFNADTWPAVRARAEGPERASYDDIKARVDALRSRLENAPQDTEPADLGKEAAWAAFVYLVSGDTGYLALAKDCLDTSLAFYEACFEQRKPVNWYSTSRVHATLAWDWLYNAFTEEERAEYMARLIHAVDNVIKAEPRIHRENISNYTTGFYGVNNCLWFIGCTAFGCGIEPDLVNEWLVWGREENLRMLEHRRKSCGDDGGGASATLGYVFGAYPWAEQNFFYTWLSSTGDNIAADWPHSAWLANYVIWNWIPGDAGPLEFGYGDTPHTTNRLSTGQLYSHMANIRHLFADVEPEAAALARHIQDIVPGRSYARDWFIYPFLLTGLDASPAPLAPERLPHARHFENMGQIFMRSGTGPDDTYCLFSCGGILAQHRHYDALNFILYHRGFLALDTGTRLGNEQGINHDHLVTYYAQTVAHNCVVIHQPGEPARSYWGMPAGAMHGGQHSILGSEVEAFEVNDAYVYVAGDGTACYRHGPVKRDGQPDLPEKCELVTRQIVFILPDHFVICDRVVATDAAYRKEWLMHTAHEPAITDTTIRADHGGGRMFCRTLLPADAGLTAVGGPGKEFWAGGQNWRLEGVNLKPEERAMMGQWRVEVSPGAARKADVFLHVIQAGDSSLDGMVDTEMIETEDACGVRMTLESGDWAVTFSTRGDLGGHVVHSGGGTPIDTALATSVLAQRGIEAGGR
ncbi:MAG: heparinase II/III family protein [Candidatus Hydrogenedentes bacterium]|nr:heparinase II/III family protein [Candidatus Hydrogenedentota bacterium]